MKLLRRSLALSVLFAFSCSTSQQDLADRNPANTYEPSPASLPAIVAEDPAMEKTLIEALKKSVKTLSPAERKTITDNQAVIVSRLKAYFRFLGIDNKLLKEALASSTAATAGVKMEVNRILYEATTQFLFCDSFVDASCLEKKPLLTPTAKYRREVDNRLAEPVRAGSRLDMEYFFTEAYDGKRANAGTVQKLADFIRKDAKRGLSIAMYGIDDIDNSMKPLYDVVSELAKKPKYPLKIVVDAEKPMKADKPWIFSYSKPKANVSRWLFGPQPGEKSTIALSFQYSLTGKALVEWNQGIKSHDQAKVRIEFPDQGIMHNKYAVMKNSNGERSVWTGTANMAETCMGTERNSNMSLYIRNDHIAKAFEDQFNHMFDYDSSVAAKSKSLVPEKGANLIVGRFHKNKVPVSQRYFKFDDGMEVRVHFSPTDDGEHRAILPMILSARPGDTIRISMFSASGYEIVRALQYAAAIGVNVKIVFDTMLIGTSTSWARDKFLNLYSKNPYLEVGRKIRGNLPVGTIEVRVDGWKGLNHYKAGSLTRRIGNKDVVDTFIVGSQNWSTSGNDQNDENMITFMHVGKNLEVGQAFNEEFDKYLWPNSKKDNPNTPATAVMESEAS